MKIPQTKIDSDLSYNEPISWEGICSAAFGHLLLIIVIIIKFPSLNSQKPKEMPVPITMAPVKDKTSLKPQEKKNPSKKQVDKAKNVQKKPANQPQNKGSQSDSKPNQSSKADTQKNPSSKPKSSTDTAQKPSKNQQNSSASSTKKPANNNQNSTTSKANTSQTSQTKNQNNQQDELEKLLNNLEKESFAKQKSNKKDVTKGGEDKHQVASDSSYNGEVSINEYQLIKQQLENNWNIPIGMKGIETINVTYRLNFDKTGNIISYQLVSTDCGSSSNSSCSIMIQTTERAIIATEQIKGLRPERYSIWQSVRINFNENSM